MVAQSAEILDLHFHLIELRLSESTHFPARRSARVPHAQNPARSSSVNPISKARRTSCTRFNASDGYCRYPPGVRFGRGKTPTRS
jgi:hypothetical protein